MTTTEQLPQIEIHLVQTNVLTRWGCTVCGGRTEKVPILAEGEDENGTIRVCEFCLQSGDFDERLNKHAADLEDLARLLRELVGRLNPPSHAEWLGAVCHADATCRLADSEEWHALSPDTKRLWIENAKAEGRESMQIVRK